MCVGFYHWHLLHRRLQRPLLKNSSRSKKVSLWSLIWIQVVLSTAQSLLYICSSAGWASHISWSKCCLSVCVCVWMSQSVTKHCYDLCHQCLAIQQRIFLLAASVRVSVGLCVSSGVIQAWSWRPTGFLPYFNTVGLVIWPVKIVPEMTYNVSSGTLNPTH